jgi:hypothetical protein
MCIDRRLVERSNGEVACLRTGREQRETQHDDANKLFHDPLPRLVNAIVSE